MINEKDNVKLWRNSNKKIIVKYNKFKKKLLI